MKYYSIGEFSKELGITVQTLRNWDKTGKLKPAYITTGKTRYYSHEQLNCILGLRQENTHKNKIIIGYYRVSSAKQKDDFWWKI